MGSLRREPCRISPMASPDPVADPTPRPDPRSQDYDTLLAEGRYRDIAEYCLRDVRATVLLFQIWKERLAGIK